MLGSIEAGGTKINCAVGDEQGNIFKQVQFQTTSPDENMKQIIDFFLSNSRPSCMGDYCKLYRARSISNDASICS